jgi:arylsulfatase A-like enzyme
MQVPGEYYARFAHITDYRRRRYHAMVAFIDAKIGEVVAALQDAGLYNSTAIFASADNGGPICECPAVRHVQVDRRAVERVASRKRPLQMVTEVLARTTFP